LVLVWESVLKSVSELELESELESEWVLALASVWASRAWGSVWALANPASGSVSALEWGSLSALAWAQGSESAQGSGLVLASVTAAGAVTGPAG
jgi:hypothetical protein